MHLAYILVWSWDSHVTASKAAGKIPQSKIVMLMDEAEAHLHPKWQRVIVPALLKCIKILSKDLEIQLILTTHSPLVVASIETELDAKENKLFTLELVDKELEIIEVDYNKFGSADSWLTSEAFGLKLAYSVGAENAILNAEKLLASENPNSEEVREVTQRLLENLPH